MPDALHRRNELAAYIRRVRRMARGTHVSKEVRRFLLTLKRAFPRKSQ
jgi:hypothetical protein